VLAMGAWAADPQNRVQSTWGLDILEAIAADAKNVRFLPHEAQGEGFTDDRSPVRVPSVRLSDRRGRLSVTVRTPGSYYPAIQIYDGPGDERIRISVDDREQGAAFANLDDRRERLFFLTQPIEFRGGETVHFETLTGEGVYRIEAIYLLATRPAPRRPELFISDIMAAPDAAGRRVTVGWLTNWPAAATLDWQPVGAQQAETEVEDTPVRNHRVIRSGLELGRSYRFQIRARNRFGEAAETPWQTVRLDAPREPAGAVRQASIPLTVRSSSGAAPDAPFPVTSGIPFPEGALGSEVGLRLLDAVGRETPLQTSVLARWPGDTVKWALIDFQAKPGEEYRLEYGSAVRRRTPASPLRIHESPEKVEITTGPLRFAIAKRTSGFLESVWLDADRDGVFRDAERILAPSAPAEFVLRDEQGQPFRTLGPPDQVVVEEQGPVRASVLVRGRHRNANGDSLFGYVLRLDAYAGQSFLRVRYTFENDHGAAEFTRIRQLTLQLPLGEGRTAWSLEGRRGGPAAEIARLRQDTDDKYAFQADGGQPETGRRANGWAEWSNRRHRVALAARDFWQNYPKELAVTPRGIEFGLCPELAASSYAEARGTVDEHRLYFYLRHGRYDIRQGMSKTHEFWLDFRPASEPATSPLETQRAPLLAIASPAWYVGSRAFGEMPAPGAPGLAARYDAAIARAVDDYLEDRERDRAYGMLNFGDWWGERGINWGNSEYDMANAMLLQFARTGDLRSFRIAEEAEWHHRDVDTIQGHRDASRVGGAYHHAIGHTGGYWAQSPVPNQGIAVGILTVDHVFVDGHLNYYYLTGDRRSLETSRKVADRYGIYETRAYDFADARIAGWHLVLTTAVYQATRDPVHLNAARLIVERALERQEADGGWNRLHICSHPNEPEHRGELGYMQGVMLAGLRRYFTLTGDERAAQAIERGTEFLLNHLWVPEAGRFKYSSCPRTGALEAADALNFLLLDGMVFAHRRSGGDRLKAVLRQATVRLLENMESFGGEAGQPARRGFGKILAMYACLAPYPLAYVTGIE
jgi:hypothetical protein